MDEDRFRRLVEDALNELPQEFAEKLDNVAVVIEQSPSREQLFKMGLSPYDLLFGLYQGVPQTKRGIYYSAPPDKITIFKSSIEAVANTDEKIKSQVRKTIIHEIGHHFGLSDRELMS